MSSLRATIISFAVGVLVGRWTCDTPSTRRALLSADHDALLQQHATIPKGPPPGLSSLPHSPFDVHRSRLDESGKRLATKLCRSTFAGCPRVSRLLNTTRVDEHMIVYGEQAIVLTNRSLGAESPVTTVGAVVAAYDRIFEATKLFSFTSWLGVSMQQDPSDALALADLLWRVRPELIVELGTNAGGGAFFFAHVARQYSPTARVLTLDPQDRCCRADTADGALRAASRDWDSLSARVCPHCARAYDTPLWRSGAVEFIHGTPADAGVVARVRDTIAAHPRDSSGAKPVVLVIDDSSHGPEVVFANLQSYASIVSRGSYFVVQDTKIDRLSKPGPAAAVKRFLATSAGAEFEVDRRPEYYVYSQHSGGFLQRRL